MKRRTRPTVRLALKSFRLQYRFSTLTMSQLLGITEVEYMRLENDVEETVVEVDVLKRLARLYYSIHSFAMSFEVAPEVEVVRSKIRDYLKTDNEEIIEAAVRQTYITNIFSKRLRSLGFKGND